MKKKIAILGSTGSIGKTVIDIIKKNKKDFEIVLLSADKNYKELFKQAKNFNVKNLIITNENSYFKLKSKLNKNIKIYRDFNNLDKIFKKKVDYIMSSITGLEGLEPTYKIIKYTKKIAIANKESIICGWNLLSKELKKNKTEFIPVDSEHFSIWYAIKNLNKESIEKIFITASGGPFYNLPIKEFKNIKVNDAIKHPNWKMGKKISIDSSTLMNKVFEIIEAKKIFNLSYNKLNILIHRNSYLHAIVKFNNGFSKLIIHDTNMKIPIFNSIYSNLNKSLPSKNLDIKKLNNFNLDKADSKRYPVIKILKKLPNKNSLFETIIVSANDELVSLFLEKKISYDSIIKSLFSFIKKGNFIKYKSKVPKNVNEIMSLKRYVQLKIRSIYI